MHKCFCNSFRIGLLLSLTRHNVASRIGVRVDGVAPVEKLSELHRRAGLVFAEAVMKNVVEYVTCMSH